MVDLGKYLLIGLICMIAVGFLRRNIYQLKVWKIVVLMFFLMVGGVAGTMILFFVETGRWGGTSFFGSIMLVPIFLVPIGKWLSISYEKMMDFCAVPICAMLAVMKVRCLESGCCSGKMIFRLYGSGITVFPSQIAEGISVLLIMCVLIWLEHKGKYKSKIYSIFLILYGVTRFVLNSFREDLTSFVWILPSGHFWSIVVIFAGVYFICKVNKELT